MDILDNGKLDAYTGFSNKDGTSKYCSAEYRSPQPGKSSPNQADLSYGTMT
jgi:hypothetical protein